MDKILHVWTTTLLLTFATLAVATTRYSTFRLGYRLIGGSLRGQSIVRQQSSIYLVSTRDEAKAAELAAVDRALICTGGEIRY